MKAVIGDRTQMKWLAKFLMIGFVACAWGALAGLDGAEGKNVTIVNLEDHAGFIIVTFSAPLQRGAACSAQHRDALVIEGNHSSLAETARKAFSLGQAVDVWGGGKCTKMNDYETTGIMQISK